MTKENPKENLLQTPAKDKWGMVEIKKRAGILAPLFSVYSKKSIGIGDLDDLKLLIDWCAKTGNSILQLLPMNELGPIFCPYDSLSSFALEPAYLALNKISTKASAAIKAKIKKLKHSFPTAKTQVDYRIKPAKIELLWEIYKEAAPKVSGEFKDFIEVNSYWLEDFALYNVLKFLQQGKAWYEWEEKYRERHKNAIETLCREEGKAILFQKWLQWQLYKQFKEAREYAQEKRILLKGDLPILVSRDSADVWAHPEYFKLEYAAGAPPDMYCAKGQRWGTPTYNWEKIFADEGRYLKEKLKYAENFYDILRIDHVVGLFRIWSIPVDEPAENHGLHGIFDPKDEHKWEEHGRKILRFILDNTKMLLCAEDLGVIPKVCTQTLKELGIPGNDVQRWTKDYKESHDFLPENEYRRLSVAMLSTHDTTNWPAWWENEAGTVDEGLFLRKCSDHRNIGYERVKEKLFDLKRSGCGRLRWLESIDSAEKLVHILGKKKEEVLDFIEIYENSFREKQKLWKKLKLSGKMREKCDQEILTAVTKTILASNSFFCVNLITDWLYLADIFQGDPYQYRINTPGTVSQKNWSLVMPLSLEELLKHKVYRQIKAMVNAAGRKGV
jgi:4-alpha-glucanotransferase